MDYPRGSVQDYSIYSNKLGEEVNFLVYLPASYSPLYKYHVLIAQDGADYFQLGRITAFTEELLYHNEIERVIIVGIPYKNGKDRLEKYHPAGSKMTSYLQFLVQELVPFIDKEFPTYQMGLGRALIGDSLAGYISFMAALTYPHTFGKVALQSPYAHDTLLSTVKQFSGTPILQIYHVIGTEETSVKTTRGQQENFIEPNRVLSGLLKEKGFPYFYQEFNGDHTWTFWQQDVKRALKYLFSNQPAT
ncbi:alpha/beta hydrolase [Neobacillus sp. LXY-4]|uniref:alpha/beta hydrolase n=1 Tax=Neobacillus sp. LXY-4 TaxID=3379826 RepID=UPI003EE18AA7